MVKSFFSTLVAIIILISLTLTEQIYVRKTFNEFKEITVAVYDKIESETAVKEDILTAQSFWIKKKETLHIFIPHNEIKEIDLWLAEATTLVENEKYDDALSKIDVVIELIEQIPKTFMFKIENIL